MAINNTGSNDGVEGDVLAYDFKPIHLGIDDKGKDTFAPVLNPVDLPEGERSGGKSESQSEREVYEIALSLLEKGGDELSIDVEDVSRGKVMVPAGLVREKFYSKHPDKSQDAKKKAFNRAVKGLVAAEKIKSGGGVIDVMRDIGTNQDKSPSVH